MALSPAEQAELDAINEELARRDRLSKSQAEIAAQIAQESDGFLPSVGRGMKRVGRGLQMFVADSPLGTEEWKNELLREIDEEEKLFEPLEEAQPYATMAGEIVGETAPFLLSAAVPGVSGALASGSRLGQALATGAVGAAEAATVARGSGQDALPAAGMGGAAAGAASLALPVLGRLGGKLINRFLKKAPTEPPVGPSGEISQELGEALKQAGLTIEDLTRYADEFPGARSRDELIRQGIFDDLDIPTTRSRITQESDDFLTERRLSRYSSDAADAFRQRLADESAAFSQQAQRQINDLGLPRQAGDTVKDALEARANDLKDEASRLYKEVADLNDGAGLPLTGDKVLMSVVDDPKAYSAYKALNNAEKQKISDILTEYGLESSEEAVENWIRRQTRAGGTIGLDTNVKPLNTSNFNDMLRDLNALIDPQNPNMNSVAGALKSGINKELDFVADAVEGSTGLVGQQAKDLINATRRANRFYQQMSGVLDEKEIVGQLIKPRKGSFDADHILASQVVDKISGGGRLGTIESTERLVRELRRAGPKGEQALGNVQSAVVLDFMNRALPKSGKLATSGMENVVDWSGTNFSKAIDSFGRDKLEALFANNPQGLNQLLKLEQAGILKTAPQNVARASGTADDLTNNIAQVLERTPLVSEYMRFTPSGQAVREVSRQAGKKMNDKQVAKQTREMLETSPVLKQKLEYLKLRYPQVAGLIAAAYVGDEE